MGGQGVSSARGGANGRWGVERQRGGAGDLHAVSALRAGAGGDGEVDLDGVPRVRILEVDRPALILGSAQPESDVDAEAAAAAGVDVVRRRSGGGAVFVELGAIVWVDLVVPAGDRLWDADVRRASWWVGDVWAAALEATGVAGAQVWRGGLQVNPWSARVCFAGVGPGEVCVDAKKMVGVSQRRTSQATLFQTAALLTWDPAPVLALLRIDAAERARGLAELRSAAVGAGTTSATALVDALVAALP